MILAFIHVYIYITNSSSRFGRNQPTTPGWRGGMVDKFQWSRVKRAEQQQQQRLRFGKSIEANICIRGWVFQTQQGETQTGWGGMAFYEAWSFVHGTHGEAVLKINDQPVKWNVSHLEGQR